MGSLLLVRPFNHGALGKTMEKAWHPQKGMEVKKLGDNCILFEFLHKKDYTRVLEGRPWAFDKNLLMIQEYDGMQRPLEIRFDYSPFWL